MAKSLQNAHTINIIPTLQPAQEQTSQQKNRAKLLEEINELEKELERQDRLQEALSASPQGMQHFFEYAPFSVEEWTTVHDGESDDDEEERSLLGEGAF